MPLRSQLKRNRHTFRITEGSTQAFESGACLSDLAGLRGRAQDFAAGRAWRSGGDDHTLCEPLHIPHLKGPIHAHTVPLAVRMLRAQQRIDEPPIIRQQNEPRTVAVKATHHNHATRMLHLQPCPYALGFWLACEQASRNAPTLQQRAVCMRMPCDLDQRKSADQGVTARSIVPRQRCCQAHACLLCTQRPPFSST